MQEIRMFLLLQFPVFSRVSENWKPVLMVMIPLEMHLVRSERAADGHTSQNSCEVNIKGQNWTIQCEGKAVFVKDIRLKI